jgi:hypothetical protein
MSSLTRLERAKAQEAIMRKEVADLGDGSKSHVVYDMPMLDPHDYWASVTDVPCPACHTGKIRWHEAGYVPGSRICDGCGKFFQARGTVADGITLMRDARFDRVVHNK